MIRSKAIPAALAAIVVLGPAAGFALAAEHEDQVQTSALQDAKVSLVDAIRTAEQRVKGKPIDAGLDHQNGNLRYEVEVLKDGVVHKVTVDAQSGEVVTASADKTHEDENGAEQEQQSDGDRED